MLAALCIPPLSPRRAPRCRPAVLAADSDDAGECTVDEMCVFFVSGNAVKSREVDAILEDLDIAPFRVQHIDIDLPELQGDPVSIAPSRIQR